MLNILAAITGHHDNLSQGEGVPQPQEECPKTVLVAPVRLHLDGYHGGPLQGKYVQQPYESMFFIFYSCSLTMRIKTI